ncbi:MAG: tRNA epoxyqueuosine(34) reductase QueG, partial [Clostridium sp.]|nr:tRNA epoxyqueuosine(34) reductase QueG [Clostridium sp.]
RAVGFVDSNSLPERYIAYLSDVGFIGKNNMIITKKHGSYVFLGEIITDLEIENETKRTFDMIANYEECGECRICIGECPTKSINKTKINPNICLSYMTQKKELNDKEINLLKKKGNIFGCDFCQLKCPYNENLEGKALKEFEILDYMNEEPYIYANMDNKYFKEKISKTSCGWRGKNVIRRNAIINLKKKGIDIEEFKGNSEYINEYIDKLK